MNYHKSCTYHYHLVQYVIEYYSYSIILDALQPLHCCELITIIIFAPTSSRLGQDSALALRPGETGPRPSKIGMLIEMVNLPKGDPGTQPVT